MTQNEGFLMDDIQIRRLTVMDSNLARKLFLLMSEVFAEECAPLGEHYLRSLLSRPDFWALAAFVDGDVVGGLTAHSLPMTRTESSEVLIYDIAVRSDQQGKGIGRQLISTLREAANVAGIADVFVPVDNDDLEALEFYRALGGAPASVTIFTFRRNETRPTA
jgi:aminoglycoside 3-N-acetyltransferase I